VRNLQCGQDVSVILQAFESPGLLGGQLQRGDRQQFGELRHRSGAGDGRDDPRPIAEPRQGNGGDRRTVSGGDLVERRQHTLAAVVQVGAGALGACTVDAAARAVLAGEKALRECEVGHARHPLSYAEYKSIRSTPRRFSDASAPARMFFGASPIRPGALPTLVAMITLFRAPRAAIQRPMIVSDSPPTCPGTHAV
jgi:hypothetical protein